MKKNKNIFHGSDVEIIAKKYSIDKDKIVNFSSNVNPMGLPNSLKRAIIDNIDLLENYPNRENDLLKNAISNYSLSKNDNIVVGNGVSEIIKVFIKTINPKKSLVVAPTYSEYERELLQNDCVVDYFELLEKQNFKIKVDDLKNALTSDYDILVLCNPNNPTGSFIKRNDMLEIVKHCKENDIFVMVDETYIEFVEGFETGEMDSIFITNDDFFDNLIVLRGVSKFYAMPGIRFGYGITNNKELISKMENVMNVWSVNSLVSVSANAVFNDKKFITASNEFINTQRQTILDALSDIKELEFYYPNANFVLVRILNDKTASELFETAIQNKIMIRNCESFKFLDNKYFRFCFLDSDSNDMLLDFLLSFFQKA